MPLGGFFFLNLARQKNTGCSDVRSEKTEMKGHYYPSILGAVLLLGAVLVSPAFADMKNVDEAELARTNASVTGVSIKAQSAGIEKGAVRQETLQTIGTFDKGDAAFSHSLNKDVEGIGLNLNISGQETFRFITGGISTTTTGGITSVKSRP
jgi:hypothetical protein